jgi:(p)ppGpp synthase/HD superfamily hydrolase
MKMNPKILKAIELAFIKHDDQYRKGTKIPYITHPLAVMNLILMEQVDDSSISDDVVIAGILHDVFEDTNTSLEEIERNFGAEVKKLVENSSEPEILKKQENKKDTWKDRKLHTIQLLKSLDKPSKILICCDKLHNAQSMNIDYIFVGNELWGRFNAPKSSIFWYYKACLDAFKTGVSIEESKVFTLCRLEVEALCSH